MIVYDLTCVCGYQFEAWFQDRSDYDIQREKGLLVCPECNCNDIHKILSPVSSLKHSPSVYSKTVTKSHEPELVHSEKEIKEFINSVSNYVKTNYEDVGVNLAEKALKMHYGVEKEKKIRGIATAKEEKMLADEGIELIKFPLPLDNKSDDEQ